MREKEYSLKKHLTNINKKDVAPLKSLPLKAQIQPPWNVRENNIHLLQQGVP